MRGKESPDCGRHYHASACASVQRAAEPGNGDRRHHQQEDERRPCFRPSFRPTVPFSNVVASPSEMNVPGFNFHSLRGFDPLRYSVHVNGPWCLTFEFSNGDAWRIDFEQYH
jgi:toxin HigB-1